MEKHLHQAAVSPPCWSAERRSSQCTYGPWNIYLTCITIMLGRAVTPRHYCRFRKRVNSPSFCPSPQSPRRFSSQLPTTTTHLKQDVIHSLCNHSATRICPKYSCPTGHFPAFPALTLARRCTGGASYPRRPLGRPQKHRMLCRLSIESKFQPYHGRTRGENHLLSECFTSFSSRDRTLALLHDPGHLDGLGVFQNMHCSLELAICLHDSVKLAS